MENKTNSTHNCDNKHTMNINNANSNKHNIRIRIIIIIRLIIIIIIIIMVMPIIFMIIIIIIIIIHWPVQWRLDPPASWTGSWPRQRRRPSTPKENHNIPIEILADS